MDDAGPIDGTFRREFVEFRSTPDSQIGVTEHVEITLKTDGTDIGEVVARLVLDFEPNSEVARARERFAKLIDRTERMLRRLERSGSSSTRDQLKCITTMADLTERDLELTMKVGLLTAVATRVAAGLDDANTVRERLKRLYAAAKFDPEDLVSDGERAWLGVDDGEGADEKKE